MSRLLHAAARGARIQADYQGVWSGVSGIHLGKTPHDYRIHPDDAHLAYGPISTALHQIVKTGKEPSNLHRDLFLMFWAEALADEGM